MTGSHDYEVQITLDRLLKQIEPALIPIGTQARKARLRIVRYEVYAGYSGLVPDVREIVTAKNERVSINLTRRLKLAEIQVQVVVNGIEYEDKDDAD